MPDEMPSGVDSSDRFVKLAALENHVIAAARPSRCRENNFGGSCARKQQKYFLQEESNVMKSWTDFKVILPNTNEFYGVNHPLLDWKSRIFGNRFDKFRIALSRNFVDRARASQREPAQVQLDRVTHAETASASGNQALPIKDLMPDVSVGALQPQLAPTIDCGVARLLQRDIGSNPPRDWRSVISTKSMTTRLEKLKIIVAKPRELQNFPDIADYVQSFIRANDANVSSDRTLLVKSLFDKEARIASFLLFLSRHQPTQLNDLFFTAHADNCPAA